MARTPKGANPGERHTTVDALIALASLESLGDPVAWDAVEALIAKLLKETMRTKQLREGMRRLNDPDLAHTLEDWFRRAAASRREVAADATRREEKIATPCQGAFFGLAAASGAGLAVGTLTVPGGFFIAGAWLAGSAAVTYARYRLSRRADHFRAEEQDILRLCEIIERRLAETEARPK